MDLFVGLFVTVACPNCHYEMDVELLSVRLESTTFCPCCKMTIRLVDAGASVYGAQEEIESAMKDCEKQIKKLNSTVRFNT